MSEADQRSWQVSNTDPLFSFFSFLSSVHFHFLHAALENFSQDAQAKVLEGSHTTTHRKRCFHNTAVAQRFSAGIYSQSVQLCMQKQVRRLSPLTVEVQRFSFKCSGDRHQFLSTSLLTSSRGKKFLFQTTPVWSMAIPPVFVLVPCRFLF